MIELLLVIIIALLCLAIYGYTYYILKIRQGAADRVVGRDAHSLPPPPKCFKCQLRKEAENEVCAKCNGKCEPMPVCPKCQECPLMVGFKVLNPTSTVKDLIIKVNEMNEVATQAFCVNKTLLKNTIKKNIQEMKEKDPNFENTPCGPFVKKIKSEFAKQINQSSGVNEELQAEILTKVAEMLDIVAPKEICTDDKLDLVKIERVMYDIIDAFCESSSVHTEF